MTKSITLSDEVIVSKIHVVRERKVIIDLHLAELYNVDVKQLRKAVRKNRLLFEEHMFELTKQEMKFLGFQINSASWGNVKYAAMALTEQGIAALSGILNNERVVLVNIHIARAFMRMREGG